MLKVTKLTKIGLKPHRKKIAAAAAAAEAAAAANFFLNGIRAIAAAAAAGRGQAGRCDCRPILCDHR